MVENADDQDGIALDHIEDGVLPMHKAAICLAIIGFQGPGVWVCRQQIERIIKTEEISVCGLKAELLHAELTYLDKVGARRRRWNDPSHGRPDTQP